MLQTRNYTKRNKYWFFSHWDFKITRLFLNSKCTTVALYLILCQLRLVSRWTDTFSTSFGVYLVASNLDFEGSEHITTSPIYHSFTAYNNNYNENLFVDDFYRCRDKAEKLQYNERNHNFLNWHWTEDSEQEQCSGPAPRFISSSHIKASHQYIRFITM